MISRGDLKEINPKPPSSSALSEHIHSGIPIPKAVRIRTFSPDDWEEFVEEWAQPLSNFYTKVRRFGGSGDLGIDIAGFCTDHGFQGVWDNYQCKRLDHPLRPSDVWVEIGKIIYYSHRGEFTPPRKHYFVCSQGIGTSLEKLLNNTDFLKTKTKENWDNICCKGITSTTDVNLSGALAAFFDNFDFKIFSSKSLVELINSHSTTRYHAVRFGGGLPPRPLPDAPPDIPAASESRYIRQLLDAYSDHLGVHLNDTNALTDHCNLNRDFLRQRERFYHAEALRNFARDTVPEGTFDALKDEIYYGIIDVCDTTYPNGFERMKKTVTHASQVSVTANSLVSATKTQDRQGICHQLANDDRLTWVPDDK